MTDKNQGSNLNFWHVCIAGIVGSTVIGIASQFANRRVKVARIPRRPPHRPVSRPVPRIIPRKF